MRYCELNVAVLEVEVDDDEEEEEEVIAGLDEADVLVFAAVDVDMEVELGRGGSWPDWTPILAARTATSESGSASRPV